MEKTDELAMIFAGKEKAYADIFRFMRVALRSAAAGPEAHPTKAPLAFAQELRIQLQIFRGEHLAIQPGLPFPKALLQVYARSYRGQFDKLHKELLQELPDAEPAG